MIRCKGFTFWALVLTCFATIARGAKAPVPDADYDRRAAATLYATKSGREVKPEAMDAKALTGIRINRDNVKGSVVYGLDFGGVEDGKDTQGLYEVAVNTDPVDWTKRNFKKLNNKDAGTDAEVYLFRTPDSAAQKYQTIRLRKTVGHVTIGIAQRRPADESTAVALKALTGRFARLYTNAKLNTLLFGEIKLAEGDITGTELSNGLPQLFTLDDKKETEKVVRIDVRDGEGNPVTNVKFLSFQLKGTLSSHVRLKVGDRFVQAETAPYILNDPGLTPSVTLSFLPPDSAEVLAALYTDSAATRPASPVGLVLEVGAAVGNETTASMSSEAWFQPIAWEPIITDLAASKQLGHAAVVKLVPPTTQPSSLEMEMAAWMALKPLIEPRKDAYTEDADVTTAWERVIPTDGMVTLDSYGSKGVIALPGDTGPRLPRVHTIASADAMMVALGLDALMNRQPNDRDELVKKYFKVLELSVVGVRIAADPLQFRAAIPVDAKEYTLLRLGSAESTAGEDLDAVGRKYNWSSAPIGWSSSLVGAGTGVFEFRVTARVQGQVSDQEEPIIKTVRGMIRVAIVDDSRLEITKFDPR